MRFFSALVLALVASVSGQRNPTLGDLEAVSAAALQAAKAYLHAAQTAKVGGSSSGGCIRDEATGSCVSFLQEKKSFLQKKSPLQPLVARIMGDSAATNGEFERMTQAPLVFFHLHK